MEISFSNIDKRKQIQRKKKNFINMIPSYLLPHTQIVKKTNMFIQKKTEKMTISTVQPSLLSRG